MTRFVTTSFNRKLWDEYASETIPPMVRFYSSQDDTQVLLWVDTKEDLDFIQEQPLIGEDLVATSLDGFDYWNYFHENFGAGKAYKDWNVEYDKIPDGHKFRYNYEPFARKVFSWVGTFLSQMQDGDTLIWFDADIVHHQGIDSKVLTDLEDAGDIIFYDRDRPWYAAETGFFLIKKTPQTSKFVELVFRQYLTGHIFDMAEWHDGFIFKTALRLIQDDTISIKSLSIDPKVQNVMEDGMFKNVLEHYKGNTKKDIKKPEPVFESLIEYDPEDQ